jgi:lysophospholipase L1-like esterase
MSPAFLLVLSLPCAAPAADFQLHDGDRVVFVGSTFIEREQRYGYWETLLTSRFPGRNVIFRNLGWSGDTVWGEARAGFDTAKEGYRRLIDATLAVKPTVIFLGYGTNESFAGQAGLGAFRQQLKKLLDDLSPARARFVLLAPPQFEKARWRAGRFEECQRDLQLYTEAIRDVAHQRQALFVDEFCQRHIAAAPLTDDGMHLTAHGYYVSAANLLGELHGPDGALKRIELDGLAPRQVLQPVLPGPPAPRDPPGDDRQTDSLVMARGLAPGRYTLLIDGRAVHSADALAWMHSVALARGPSLDQAEKLRQAIVEKNRLFFYRWRPENETYLFGFRQNAREIPEFDPLVARQEQEIARLRTPVAHTYQLKKAND